MISAVFYMNGSSLYSYNISSGGKSFVMSGVSSLITDGKSVYGMAGNFVYKVSSSGSRSYLFYDSGISRILEVKGNWLYYSEAGSFYRRSLKSGSVVKIKGLNVRNMYYASGKYIVVDYVSSGRCVVARMTVNGTGLKVAGYYYLV